MVSGCKANKRTVNLLSVQKLDPHYKTIIWKTDHKQALSKKECLGKTKPNIEAQKGLMPKKVKILLFTQKKILSALRSVLCGLASQEGVSLCQTWSEVSDSKKRKVFLKFKADSSSWVLGSGPYRRERRYRVSQVVEALGREMDAWGARWKQNIVFGVDKDP